MNDGTLIRKSLFRKKTRAILLVLSIMTAFLVFGLLGAIARPLNAGAEGTASDRLISINSVSFIQPLPITYFARVQAMEGVQDVVHLSWVQGYYQDAATNSLTTFAVDFQSYFDVYDEFEFLEGSLAILQERRDCVAVGQPLIDKYEEFSLGARFPLSSGIWQRMDGTFTWDVEICAIFDSEESTAQTGFVLLNYDYFNEARSFGQDNVGWLVIRTGDPASNDAVSQRIDEMFANSRAATETTTEAAFGAAFVAQIGNISLILTLSTAASFGLILVIVGTTMVLASNERRKDVAIMKTLGFSEVRIFAHVIGESVLLSLVGGLLGLALAYPLSIVAGAILSAIFPGVAMTGELVLQAVAIMIVFGLVTGFMPALNAMRLNIVDGLNKD